MPDYDKLIDAEIWAFIDKTNASYPFDTPKRTIDEQRAIYNAMCEKFRMRYPAGITARDEKINDVPVRVYGIATPVRVIYFHGGGFVVGGLESHDDVCAEIADYTGLQTVSIDYRLSPEHPHPAAFDDALAVSEWGLTQGDIILVGDSAGGNLAAAVAGRLCRRVKGQVLIYPALGGDINKGSYLEHAKAPLLTRDEVLFYVDIRSGEWDDPTLNPLLAGSFDQLPPTIAFAAECDPLYDDCFEYAEAIRAAGGKAKAVHDRGLVHGHLRARHMSVRAAESFAQIKNAIATLARGEFP